MHLESLKTIYNLIYNLLKEFLAEDKRENQPQWSVRIVVLFRQVYL